MTATSRISRRNEASGRQGRRWPAVAAMALTWAMAGQTAPALAQDLLNVSYDPTREFYREYNEILPNTGPRRKNPQPASRLRMADRGRRPARSWTGCRRRS